MEQEKIMYQSPEMDIVFLELKDTITTSGDGLTNGGEGGSADGDYFDNIFG